VLEAGEDVAQTGEVAGGGLAEDHAAGSAAGSGADGFRFEDYYRFGGIEMTQPSGRRQP
jgi:hypothetical protein